MKKKKFSHVKKKYLQHEALPVLSLSRQVGNPYPANVNNIASSYQC